jgi:DNA gyrase subunit A
VFLATRNGVVKKTELDAFSSIRSTGIIAIDIDEGDTLVGARLTDGKSDIALCTLHGWVARFREEKVRAMGRTARGIRGVKLREDDKVVALRVLDRDLPTTLLTVCERGYGKRTPATDYPVKGRGGKGVITIKTNERNGNVVGVLVVIDSDELMLVTDTGRVIRIRVRDIPTRGRNTQGVRLIRLDVADGERVVAVEAFSDLGVPDGTEGGEAGEPITSTVEVLDDDPEAEPEGDLDEDDGDDDEEDAG